MSQLQDSSDEEFNAGGKGGERQQTTLQVKLHMTKLLSK